MQKLLYDSSSLIKAFKERKVDLLDGNYIQWLTIYEVLNPSRRRYVFLNPSQKAR